MKTIIETPNAPSPIGPYSQAVRAGKFLFISGQVAINPSTGELNMPDIKTETQQVMKNLSAILQEAKLNFTHVVKTSIFLKNMDDFAKVNEEYGKFFTGKEFPARETVQVAKLPRDVNVEISMIAYAKEKEKPLVARKTAAKK